MMPGCTCVRCGDAGVYFIEYVEPETESHRTTWLCRAHAIEAAEILRNYERGCATFTLGLEDSPSMLMPQATITPLPGLQISLSGAMADRVTEVNVKIPPQEASE